MAKIVIVLVAVVILNYALAQDADCDFQQKIGANEQYFIYNPDYPKYKPGRVCRYIATCPDGYNCRVDCTLNMPQGSQCSIDQFLVSKSGDPQLVSANVYCGVITFTASSLANTITLGLISSKDSPGGQYKCNLTAQPDTTQPTCRCGDRKMTKIVGGTVVGEDEYPMMAGIIEKSIDELYCGGTVISDRYILTAAHCLYKQRPQLFEVVVGSRDLNKGKRFAIQSFIPHEKFDENTYDYDIGLVLLKNSLPLSSSVQPACLPFKYINMDFTGFNTTLTGWGTQYPGGPKSPLLRQVQVSVISRAVCRRYTSNITDRQLCTYARGKDACQNDSGGPALYPDPNSGSVFIIGVVSNGIQCASTTPGFNTNVPALLQWVLDKAKAEFCIKR